MMMMMYERPIRPDELYHFGVLGMKWGVRRYQNKDGTLTSAGRKRYGIGQAITKSMEQGGRNHYKNLAKKNKEYRGLTNEELNTAAKRRADYMKKALIGTGVILGATAALYLANRMSKGQFDDVIKAGMKIQTVHMDPDRLNAGKDFYAAHRKLDKVKYKGLFGQQQGLFGPVPGEYKHEITADVTKNIKIAGGRTGKKVYEDLLKNDADFAAKVKEAGYTSYKGFNTNVPMRKGNAILDPDGVEQAMYEKFTKALKDKGYGGMADLNDRLDSGYNTKANIIFDDSNISNIKARQLTYEEINKAKNKGMAMVIGDQLIRPDKAATIGGSTALLGASIAADSKTKRDAKKHRTKVRAKK